MDHPHHHSDHTQKHGHAHHNHHDHKPSSLSSNQGNFKLAVSATLHCLLGCGIGEVLGMIIATWLGLSMTSSMILAVVLGFVMGLLLGIIPLLKRKFSLGSALKTVLIAEGLSIAVMEAVEVFVQVKIPGVMEAGLTAPLFWLGMLAGLAAGFVAALPVNYFMIKRGVRHQH